MLRQVFKLLKLPALKEVAQENPKFAFKYLVPDYLVRGFTSTECVSCFLHHYRRIYATLPENILRRIVRGNVTLYETAEGGRRFAVTLGLFEQSGDNEGELSLNLRVDGERIFNLSFTIVPGWVVRSATPEILLITRIQGRKGSRRQIKLARKAFHEFFPSKLLLAAVQGIAEALGIGELQAVCAERQRSYKQGCPAIFKNCYDDFFAEVGMVKTAAGFYSSPIPIRGKALESFKRRNRSRARKRRAIRQRIQSACAAFLLGAADRQATTHFPLQCARPRSWWPPNHSRAESPVLHWTII